MPKITACIISFNEEAKIRDCLISLSGIVDEIVIVDSESEDRTREIAYDFTDKIHLQPFLGHIEQKNLAVSFASHDWILSLDCDERLSQQAREEILAVKENLDDFSAYSFPRKTFYVYRWLEHCWYPDRKVRLFNKQKARWAGVNPHDHVEVKGKVRKFENDILHYSFDSVGDHVATLQRFTDIAARELEAKGKKVSALTPLLHAFWTFLRVYLFRGGFRDGFAGLTASLLSFTHVYVKYAKVYSQRKRHHYIEKLKVDAEAEANKRENGEEDLGEKKLASSDHG